MKKILLALLAVIVLAVSSSGCIDVQLGKEIFGGSAPIKPAINFKTVSKANLSYVFTTIIPEEHTDSCNVSVAQGCFRLIINIAVTIQPPVETPSAGQRYVIVSVSYPDSSIYDERKYTESAQEPIIIDNPVSGGWTLSVEAQGSSVSLGGISFNDSFSIEIVAEEPI